MTVSTWLIESSKTTSWPVRGTLITRRTGAAPVKGRLLQPARDSVPAAARKAAPAQKARRVMPRRGIGRHDALRRRKCRLDHPAMYSAALATHEAPPFRTASSFCSMTVTFKGLLRKSSMPDAKARLRSSANVEAVQAKDAHRLGIRLASDRGSRERPRSRP